MKGYWFCTKCGDTVIKPMPAAKPIGLELCPVCHQVAARFVPKEDVHPDYHKTGVAPCTAAKLFAEMRKAIE
jgi:hypothetical protein